MDLSLGFRVSAKSFRVLGDSTLSVVIFIVIIVVRRIGVILVTILVLIVLIVITVIIVTMGRFGEAPAWFLNHKNHIPG